MKSIVTAAFAICLMSGTSALAASNNNNNNSSSSGAPHTGTTHVTVTSHTGGPNPSTLHTGSIVAGPQITSHSQGAPSSSTPLSHTVHTNTIVPTFTNQNNGPTHTFHPNTGAPIVTNQNNGPITTFHRNMGSQGPVRTTSVTTFHPKFGAPGFNPGGPRPRYSPQFFPHTFNLGSHFHWRGANWSGPRGYYYRPWYYGEFLPFGWFASEWWINDYYDYDLPVPPYGYEWVRNGPDALLVNIDTGMIAEDVPGVFY